MKKLSFQLLTVLFLLFSFAACSDDSVTGVDNGDTNGNGNGEEETITTIDDETTELSGEMRGTLRAGQTYTMVGDVIIPAGEEIVAEEGVTVIAADR